MAEGSPAAMGAASGRRALLKAPPTCSGAPQSLSYQCTGSPGFWMNNGYCSWPTDHLVVGTPGGYDYSKAQLYAAMDLATGPSGNDLLKLIYQLVPAMLNKLNLAQGGYTVPSDIEGNITLANQIIGDRVFEPVGNGLCPCCDTSSCGAGSVCRPASQGGQGCRPLSNTQDGIGTIASVLAPWNRAGESNCNGPVGTPVSRPSPPPPSTGCAYTVGYWKTHPRAWPAAANAGFKLGSVFYTKNQLLRIMNQPVNGNGLINLAYQLIAAKINILQTGPNKPSVPPTVSQAIAQADAKIGNRKIPPIGTDSLPTAQTSSLVTILTQFNQGDLAGIGGPVHCSR
ncbi:hypothetical protein ABPG75_010330 [Micractinium tetrahymenae]